MRHFSRVLALSLPLYTLGAQGHKQLTPADYDRAVKMLGPAVTPLVIGGQVNATWTPDGKFYYRATRIDGSSWLLVDPAKKKSVPLFDHSKLAAGVSAASGGSYTAASLPFVTLDLSPKRDTVSFSTAGKRYACALKSYACKQIGDAPGGSMPAMMGRRGPRGLDVPSPDGKTTAFIRNWNLWVRDAATNAETQLTTDGVPDFGYATDNAGWVHSARAVLKWSPDSKKIATQQQDDRKLNAFHMVRYQVGAPKLESWKYPFAGDAEVSRIHRVVIDVPTKTVTRLKMAPDFHRAMLGDDISMDDLQWKDDGSMLAIASTPRDHKAATLRIANTTTGDVRDVFTERSPHTSSPSRDIACCGTATRSSGTPSAPTGASSTCMTSSPVS